MVDRRTSERLLVGPESLEQILPEPVPQLAVVKVAERLIVPAETLDRVDMDEPRHESEDRTEPIRLSFLALLAERDPAVQARLNRRITTQAVNLDDENRPTDPFLVSKASGS
jgi:hypothetical protein